ncbi:hypothetical protein [Pseudomonas cavernae]|uniref:hypothetical protein n=1 Tax=Pseudomonas cavernae TaxID=2320867 RepID=UPI0015ACCC50|nr:hypothetical protein [Pseudomonas cavernae]
MERDKRTRLESFSAREDDRLATDDELYDYRQPAPQRQARPRHLVLQIALGVWLGGMALMLTWLLLSLLLGNFAGNLLNGSLTPKFGAALPALQQPMALQAKPASSLSRRG